MDTELRNIPGLKPEDVVVIKKFTYGDKNRLTGKCVVINFKTQKPEFDVGEYRTYVLYYGIKSASFLDVHTDKLKVIEELYPETGEFLFNKILEFNNMSENSQDLVKG